MKRQRQVNRQPENYLKGPEREEYIELGLETFAPETGRRSGRGRERG